ncbi:DUF5675 family protein [Salinisphaera sp. G21_0]|uniref:DUF5675 family protein n=1 Tax=Salinisphaera sp. G21_0 TaxID=2821094 RepID=UPI001ADAF974|nr:DUF5675 family protein [Salinisphaera sp. G21_0]MBO9483784.1 hypothetical protein [Salinisphaera sp. G21_0]
MLLTLERSYLQHCVIGELHVPGFHTYATIERPWRGNERNISCIPEGVYNCVPHNGQKFKNVWRLENVPDRSAILIHVGNYAREVQGCIAVGKMLSATDYMVQNSAQAMDELRGYLPETFQIRITVKHPEYP